MSIAYLTCGSVYFMGKAKLWIYIISVLCSCSRLELATVENVESR